MRNRDKVFQEALGALNRGGFSEAERLFRKVLSIDSRHLPSLNLLTIVLMNTDRPQEAEQFISRAVKLDGKSDVSLYNYGLLAKRLNRADQALELFTNALSLNENVPETWNNRGTIFNDLQKYEAAIADFDRAISLNANYAEAHANKGKSLTKLERYDEALGAYDRALAINADLAEAWMGRGNACRNLKRHDDALAACHKALTLKPDFAEAWLAYSDVLVASSRYDEATAAFGKALALKPDLAEAWLGLARLHASAYRADEALAAYDRALALKPDSFAALAARGNALVAVGRYDEAFSDLDKALVLDPDGALIEGLRLHAKMCRCDWNSLGADRAHLKLSIENGVQQLPFVLLAVSASPAEQLQCARLRNKIEYSSFTHPVWRGERYSHDRIRVAYLSADLREHAVGNLIAGVFEHHDKSRFEVTGISFVSAPDSPMQQRMRGSLEHFIDVQHEDGEAIARLLRRLEIDIAIDLMGFTGNNRASVFARRPVPIQASYLGYSGTMGSSYIDYIIADPVVIPCDHFEFFDEKVVWLPGSFMPNDARRPVAQGTPRRIDHGLPDEAFVFCCFNHSYKFNPETFAVWMRLLKAIPNSVLWLSAQGASATANLRRQAEASGVSSGRLVFAARVPALADHLARHRLADLFLDTLPYNAHSTANDSLAAGVPVLTRAGQTFAGRVAASLLSAIGLPELIADSEAAYEQMALELANDPAKLNGIRQKLAANCLNSTLFDTQSITRRLEAAYAKMHERHHTGLPPNHFAIETA